MGSLGLCTWTAPMRGTHRPLTAPQLWFVAVKAAKTGGTCRQVQPEVATKMTAASTARSSHLRCRDAGGERGREWARVKIADDFTPPKDSDQHDDTGHAVPGPIDDGEARLAYVAVTRTRRRLDIGGLSWIHDHPGGSPGTPVHSEPRARLAPAAERAPVPSVASRAEPCPEPG